MELTTDADRVHNFIVNDEKPDDDQIEYLFEHVLEQLLTLPHVIKNLQKSQSTEKKWALIKMNSKMFDNTKDDTKQDQHSHWKDEVSGKKMPIGYGKSDRYSLPTTNPPFIAKGLVGQAPGRDFPVPDTRHLHVCETENCSVHLKQRFHAKISR